MLKTLRNPTFRHLFAAQLVALIGTGLATVALGLLAWKLAGDNAGAVLGTALAIKMVAYVTLAPVAAAVAERLPRRAFLVALDLIRAVVIACLPFVDQVWQIYVLIFFLQAASAGFTPAFQAVIPDVLKDEDDYTNALSLLRLAEDLEQLASPMIAAALLTVVSFPVLFVGTVVGFVVSALLVVTARLPDRVRGENSHFWADVTKGIRIYTRTPRLRGLMVMEAAVAAAGAMVYVNTVVLVQARLGLGEESVALAFAGFGAGSMLAAFLLPRILDRLADRPVMIGGAALMVAGVALVPLVGSLITLIALWAIIGFGFSLTQTPIGRIINRSTREADRGAVFAAQFALSHACWLVTYPLAGWVGAGAGLTAAALVLAGIGAFGLFAVMRIWPAQDASELAHDHPDLPPDHPHLAEHGARHAHAYVIDDLHRRWPRAA
ncbi:MAG: MFS transporter [Pseudotabrizicola sp.]|uniref:MFS transporter n=1 Tax=Pseudotabrizicola sp. TaxID=2939647 RepID=UPI0027191C77|nr:MFS transporter [Pseudotabrizicola sp.]MDO8885102.1 MFS transporter [Pseudotabrizicola sp.]MDP2081013.1 MFS transporter [Pseudotabrizicola sp.]MDZ7573989.1 MFS transporter [Pseudotabrizicola sp.]